MIRTSDRERWRVPWPRRCRIEAPPAGGRRRRPTHPRPVPPYAWSPPSSASSGRTPHSSFANTIPLSRTTSTSSCRTAVNRRCFPSSRALGTACWGGSRASWRWIVDSPRFLLGKPASCLPDSTSVELNHVRIKQLVNIYSNIHYVQKRALPINKWL